MQNARHGTIPIGIPGFPIAEIPYDERPGIQAQGEVERARIRQQHQDRDISTDIALEGERESLQAGLARNPIGARAIDIGTAGYLRSRQLELEGEPGEAKKSLANTILEEQLLKQNYFDAFKGEARDTRLFNVTNPRDVTDPAAVVKAINDQTQRVEKAIADLGSD
jgi:hypothetical protein